MTPRENPIVVAYLLVIYLLASAAAAAATATYGMTTIEPNGTVTVPGMPGTTIEAPPGSTISNITITTLPPLPTSTPTINFTSEPAVDHFYYHGIKEAIDTIHQKFTIKYEGKTYKGYYYWGGVTPNLILLLCAHYADTLKDIRYTHKDCATLPPSK